MSKGKKMFLIMFIVAIIMICLSIYVIYNYNSYLANKLIENIEIGDNSAIEEQSASGNLVQTQINNGDIIGTLTIPQILLADAPIKESTELDVLSEAIGHFTSTSIYSGNIGLAAHNSGDTEKLYFKNLHKLEKGSEIYYQTDFGTKRYVVEVKEIIDETDFSYLQQTKDNRITLITCVNNQPTKRLCIQAVESYENMINNE